MDQESLEFVSESRCIEVINRTDRFVTIKVTRTGKHLVNVGIALGSPKPNSYLSIDGQIYGSTERSTDGSTD